jgi:hypothetical protein
MEADPTHDVPDPGAEPGPTTTRAPDRAEPETKGHGRVLAWAGRQECITDARPAYEGAVAFDLDGHLGAVAMDKLAEMGYTVRRVSTDYTPTVWIGRD